MMENLPIILIGVGLVLLLGIHIADRRAIKRDDELLDIPEDIYDDSDAPAPPPAPKQKPASQAAPSPQVKAKPRVRAPNPRPQAPAPAPESARSVKPPVAEPVRREAFRAPEALDQQALAEREDDFVGDPLASPPAGDDLFNSPYDVSDEAAYQQDAYHEAPLSDLSYEETPYEETAYDAPAPAHAHSHHEPEYEYDAPYEAYDEHPEHHEHHEQSVMSQAPESHAPQAVERSHAHQQGVDSLREPTPEELSRQEVDFPLDDTLDHEETRYNHDIEQEILNEYDRDRGPSAMEAIAGFAGRVKGSLRRSEPEDDGEAHTARHAAPASKRKKAVASKRAAPESIEPEQDPLFDGYEQDEAYYDEPRYQSASPQESVVESAGYADQETSSYKDYELPRPDRGDRILSLYVAAPSGQTFDGERVKALFAHQGYEYGKQKIFHSIRDGKVIFSVANMVKPGFFELGDMNSMQTPGIALFAGLGGPIRDDKLFDILVQEAATLAHHLNGHLLDQWRNTMTNQTLHYVREQLIVQAKERDRLEQQQAQTQEKRGLFERRSKPRVRAKSKTVQNRERLKDRV